jgi:hypothetical protein
MGLLARALRLSGPTLGRPPYYSQPSPEYVVPMVPDLVKYEVWQMSKVVHYVQVYPFAKFGKI